MAKVILRQEAIDDLNNIWEYPFEKWSEAHADKYYSMLRHAFVEIGKMTKADHYSIQKLANWGDCINTYFILRKYCVKNSTYSPH